MERKKLIFCYLMVAPSLLFTVVLGILPMLASLGISFLEYDLLRVRDFGTPFVGVDNYITVLTDARFIQSVWNTLLITGLVVAIVIALGLLLAQVMDAEYRGRALIRVLICAPWFVPPVVAAAIWSWMLSTSRSPLNAALMDAGIIDSNIRFLSDTETIWGISIPLLSVTAVRIWNGLPFVVIFILAGLQSIPKSLYEAGSIDGASVWNQFRFITLPLLKPILGVLLLLLLITGIGHFEINYIMTGGGPQGQTNVMAVYAYQQAFNSFRFDYAAAASGVIFVITGIICFFYIRAQLKDGDDA
ncbi:carbohydrate ABC transporter permease [Litoreibacter albidus]|uniref:Carbohydrate ABC transporter membrane protein 1, CUT1 family n=1 Tax=Litoreibacter albidus TaxID=670155 RepID=A0A1H3CR96_9RHOB|nr:sugar ABC transporter permease [Litoreibacter albidus]SDX56064.1 carbohydrate ABC transporter membrane protein 1, CUT1 family [Litoreibacter albidus]